MTQISLPYILVGGQPENADQLQDNLEAIRDVINGNIDATNLSAGAVSTSELAAQAVTAAKIDATALNALSPYTVDVNPFPTAATHTTFNTLTAESAAIMNGYLASSGAQNSEVGWDIGLAAGTWTFSLLHGKGSSSGIFTVSLDAVSVGTIDAYAAGTSYNNLSTIASIAVATGGKKRLLLKMATKNGSSSSYVGRVQALGWRRTA